MNKTRKIIFLILIFAMFLVLSNTVFAADKLTATTTDDLGNTYNWEYELNDNGEIVKLVCTNSDKTSIKGAITIPSVIDKKTVVGLGENAFYKYTELTSIVLPKSLKNAVVTVSLNPTGPFSGCDKITNVVFEDGITVIPEGICEGLTGITEITIPNTVTDIEQYAFKNCTGLTKINFGTGVTSIGVSAFKNCTGLTSIVLPKSLKNADMTVSLNPAGPLSGCDKITNVVFEDGITVIPEGICEGLTGITEIIIPNTVTDIEQYAFSNCEKLVKITILGDETKIVETLGASIGDVFYNHNDNLTVYCYKDSVAAKYAIDHNIKYVYLEKKKTNPGNTTKNETNTSGGSTTRNEANISGESTTKNETKGTSSSTSNKADGSTTKSELPKTGKSMAILGGILLVVILGVAGFAKYYSYRDVK